MQLDTHSVKHRGHRCVLPAQEDSASSIKDRSLYSRRRRLLWVALLKKVLDVDALIPDMVENAPVYGVEPFIRWLISVVIPV